MKVWISKYALSDGLYEVEAAIKDGGRAIVNKGGYVSYFSRNEYHHTREEAVTKAKQRRMDKIASLRKQIEKLEGLMFV